MINLGPFQRYFLYKENTDMRKSFNGLGGIVVNEVKKDLYSGDVFIFTNKRRDQIRLLVWDRDGFWVCAKRLEEGTFQIPENNTDTSAIELKWDTLMMMIEGINFERVSKRKRYSIPVQNQ